MTATTTTIEPGALVDVQIARGWHMDDHFVARGGYRRHRVLAAYENGWLCVTVDSSGRVWDGVNVACIRGVAQ